MVLVLGHTLSGRGHKHINHLHLIRSWEHLHWYNRAVAKPLPSTYRAPSELSTRRCQPLLAEQASLIPTKNDSQLSIYIRINRFHLASLCPEARSTVVIQQNASLYRVASSVGDLLTCVFASETSAPSFSRPLPYGPDTFEKSDPRGTRSVNKRTIPTWCFRPERRKKAM